MSHRKYFLRYTREWGTSRQLISHVLSPLAGFAILALILGLCTLALGANPAYLLMPITIIFAVALFLFVSHSSKSHLEKSLREIDELKEHRDTCAEKLDTLVHDLGSERELTPAQRCKLFEVVGKYVIADEDVLEAVQLYNRRARRASKSVRESGVIPTELESD